MTDKVIKNITNESIKKDVLLLLRFVKNEKLYQTIREDETFFFYKLFDRISSIEEEMNTSLSLITSVSYEDEIINKWETFYLKKKFNITKKDIIYNYFKQHHNKEIYKLFTKNLYESTFSHNSKTIKKYIERVSIFNFINKAFRWRDTIQGHAYWDNESNNFRNHLIKITNDTQSEK